MRKSDIADPETSDAAFGPRAFPQPPEPRPSSSAAVLAEQFLASARQVWHRDRTLAARHIHEALRLDPAHPQANNMMAGYFYHSGLVEEALPYSAQAAELSPDNPEVATDHALVLDMLGRADEALALVQRHLDAGRLTPELVLRFASLTDKRDANREVALGLICQALSIPTLAPLQRKGLHFYASKLLDREKRYDEAFEQARQMHSVAPVHFDPHAFRQQMTAMADWFSAKQVAKLPKAMHGWGQPVFIVGMPRSGTTLVEQILDSHPDVFGAGELLDFTRVVDQAARLSGSGRVYDRLGSGGYTPWLAGATPAQLEALAGLYLSRVTTFAPNSRYITDKLPFNWMHLGLISRAFPQAHVIHVVRDPLDTCLSCYMTHFHDAVAYSTDLANLGLQYNDQLRLMAHWRRVLEVPILEVSYEALVAAPEAQVRRMLTFLDLPWDERCLSFHQNRRVAYTASVDQVRRPMYSSSIGRWQHYRKHLAPLADALGVTMAPPPKDAPVTAGI